MKKLIVSMLSLLMVFSVCLTFAGCDSGTYKFYGVKSGEREIKLGDLTDENKTTFDVGKIEESTYIKLNGNDTYEYYSCQVNAENDNYKTETIKYGTYGVYGQKLFIYASPQTAANLHEEWTIRDGKIYISMGNFEYIYKK